MDLKPVPFRSPLSAYEQQAEALLAGHRAADPAAIDLFHHRHPRFLDERIKWRPKFIPDSEIRDTALSLDDAKLTIARYYEFADWPSLIAYVEGVAQDCPFFEFESAVEAAGAPRGGVACNHLGRWCHKPSARPHLPNS